MSSFIAVRKCSKIPLHSLCNGYSQKKIENQSIGENGENQETSYIAVPEAPQKIKHKGLPSDPSNSTPGYMPRK